MFSQSNDNADHYIAGMMVSRISSKEVGHLTYTTSWSMDKCSPLFRRPKVAFSAKSIPEQLSTAEASSEGMYSMLPGYDSTKTSYTTTPFVDLAGMGKLKKLHFHV